MNVWGIVIIALGVILIVMGIKGSQHNVLSVLQNVHLRSGSSNTGPAPAPPTGGQGGGGGGGRPHA
jgi:hypothetical protein